MKFIDLEELEVFHNHIIERTGESKGMLSEMEFSRMMIVLMVSNL